MPGPETKKGMPPSSSLPIVELIGAGGGGKIIEKKAVAKKPAPLNSNFCYSHLDSEVIAKNKELANSLHPMYQEWLSRDKRGGNTYDLNRYLNARYYVEKTVYAYTWRNEKCFCGHPKNRHRIDATRSVFDTIYEGESIYHVGCKHCVCSLYAKES